MKKILAILASISLIGTSAATVIACGNTETKDNERNSSVKLKEELRRKIILDLKKADGTGSGNGIDLGNRWDDQDLDALIDNFINDEISKLYTKDVVHRHLSQELKMQNINQNAEIQFGKDNVKDADNVAIQEVNQTNHQNSLMNFFTTYTTSISKDKVSALDLDENGNYGQLNPTIVDDKEVNNVGIYWLNDDKSTYTRWTGVTDAADNLSEEEQLNISLGAYIPDQSLLSQDNRFILVENGTDLKLTSKPATVLKDNVSGIEALGYRFQNYIRNEIENKNYQNMLTTQFMKDGMYRYASAPNSNASAVESASKQGLYYNPDSDFVRNVQNWDQQTSPTGNQENFSTDLKMVWTISLNSQTTDGQTQIQNANKILNDNQDRDSMGDDDFATYREKTTSLYKLDAANKSTNALEILNLLTAIDGNPKATTLEETITKINTLNKSDKGSDPIFGIQGFQGFVRNTGANSVEAILGGDLTVNENAKTKIAKVKGSTALKSERLIGTGETHDFIFNSANEQTRPGYRDIIIVLPIYLIDLWKKVSEPGIATPPAVEQNTDPNILVDLVTNTWIELLPQVTNAKWQGVDPSESTGWTKVSENSEAYPTTNSYKIIEGKTYIYIPQEDKTTAPTVANLTINNESISFKFNNQQPSWEDTHNYGVSGIGHSNNPMATNGQLVKFNVHLGSDSNLSDYITNLWAQRSANVKRSDDLAYLTADKKEQLVNTLLYIIATKEENIAERAKQTIYQMYIKESDIYYQSLYDRLIRYIKDDNKDVEPSD